jgi:hypothetical protein
MDVPVDVCHCGSFEFERVVVERRPRPAVITDFVACTACAAMYFYPLPRSEPSPTRLAAGMQAIGPPPPPRTWPEDSAAALKRDATEAAKDYVKPGRHRPPRRRS